MYIKHITGKNGEDIVCKYLEKNNYKIVDRNFRCKQGEIDIIAFDYNKKELVFIEVKTRCNNKYGRPAECVDNKKKKHIINCAKYYIYINNYQKYFLRIDVIEVYIKNDNYTINHLKQII